MTTPPNRRSTDHEWAVQITDQNRDASHIVIHPDEADARSYAGTPFIAKHIRKTLLTRTVTYGPWRTPGPSTTATGADGGDT